MGAASQLAFDLDASAGYYAAHITQDRIAPPAGRKRKFTDEQERAIRTEFAEGQTQSALALKHGVSQTTIGNVLARGEYQPVDLPPAAPKRGRLVKIPRTSARSEQMAFAKLLCRVDPQTINGFGFEGIFLRPGRTIEESALWPTDRYPTVPIVLEFAGKRTVRGVGHNGEDLRMALYVLWRLDGRTWTEVARAYATSTEWAYELRSIASRLVGHAGVDVLPSLASAAARISSCLTQEFAELEPRDRARLVGVLHDLFGVQLAAVDQRELTA